jgi:signal transduction histidine kinase
LIVLLRGLRLPLKQVKDASKEMAGKCLELRGGLDSFPLPDEVRAKIDGPEGGELFQTARNIWQGAAELDVLPQGLLRLGQLRKVLPRNEWLDMNSLVVDVVRDLQDDIDRMGATVEMTDLPACLGDRGLVSEVFRSLIHNAVKYADPQRPCKVRLWGWFKDSSAFYCVEDNGIGIAEKNLERIFEIFYRVEPGINRSEGLGLTMVRKIVERHHGRLWVKSSPDKGSTFTVSLPAHEDALAGNGKAH